MRLSLVEGPARASNTVYEQAVAAALAPMVESGVSTVAFGDLFLSDIRVYREQLMDHLGLTAIFPVWARDTRAFVEEFIELGFEAIVVSTDPARLDPGFTGRLIDASFITDLPANVDPCGENGEFHSFVFGGPGFASQIDLTVGPRSINDDLCYQAITAGPRRRSSTMVARTLVSTMPY